MAGPSPVRPLLLGRGHEGRSFTGCCVYPSLLPHLLQAMTGHSSNHTPPAHSEDFQMWFDMAGVWLGPLRSGLCFWAGGTRVAASRLLQAMTAAILVTIHLQHTLKISKCGLTWPGYGWALSGQASAFGQGARGSQLHGLLRLPLPAPSSSSGHDQQPF